jgi:hypothetical protein
MALPRPSPPHQLPLPSPASTIPVAPALLVPPLPPNAVWQAMTPAQHAQIRQSLVALLQEVVHVGDAPREDYPPAP